MSFVEDNGCVTGGVYVSDHVWLILSGVAMLCCVIHTHLVDWLLCCVLRSYQLEVSASDVFKLEAAAERLMDFQKALRAGHSSMKRGGDYAVILGEGGVSRGRTSPSHGSGTALAALDVLMKDNKTAPVSLTVRHSGVWT